MEEQPISSPEAEHSPDTADSPVFMKLHDVVQIGNRLYYVRKITNKDFILRPIRRDQYGRIKNVETEA